jgi:GT2 family glycosyltransferase
MTDVSAESTHPKDKNPGMGADDHGHQSPTRLPATPASSETLARLDAVSADRDRLHGLLVVERAKLESIRAETNRALEDAHHQYEALLHTKLFRYSAALRKVYGHTRALLHPVPSSPEMPETPPSVPTPSEVELPGSYAQWIADYDTPDDGRRRQLRAMVDAMTDPPLLSVILPVFNASESLLRGAINSVIDQVYPHWELCIADDASTAPWIPRILDEYEQSEPRIRVVRRTDNGHISAAANSALAVATGTWVGFLDHDDALSPHALALVALRVLADPDLGLLYSDEDKIDLEGVRSDPYFKPDWDPVLLLGQNYLTHFCVVRRDLVEALGGLRQGFEGAQDWDLAFRITEQLREDQVGHIPHVLYHWRLHPASTAANQAAKPYAAEAARRTTTEHLDRTGQAAHVEPLGRIGYQCARFDLPNEPPLVSIIIPTRDGPLLRRCLDSIWYWTRYPNYEILLMDNGSEDPAILGHLSDHADKMRIFRDDSPFNFSALNNAAALHARGDVLCLLNDDIEVTNGDWLNEMVALVLQPGVGIVGAKLTYPDRTIQHAGVVFGIGGIAGHSFRGFDPLFFGHFGHAVLARRCTAVTGACLVTRRQLWQDLGGLDEDDLAISYSDLDYCLRARAQGWHTLWTPLAELIHYESTTRGADADPANKQRADREFDIMMNRWGAIIGADPAYNPNLTLKTEDYDLAWPPRLGPFESAAPV